jgi:imidazoleglycerol-phosphate dehydratase
MNLFMRKVFEDVEIERRTRETEIILKLNLNSQGVTDIDTGIGFFDHMLELFAFHGFIDLALNVEGDLDVDEHHTVEDVGIAIGQAISQAVGDKAGIRRYGEMTLPMDETLVQVVLDLSGRAYYSADLEFRREAVGDLPVELVDEFFRALSSNCGMTLHIRMIRGGNAHHLIEACFKAFGRALDQALTTEERLHNKPLSTKGSLREGGSSFEKNEAVIEESER